MQLFGNIIQKRSGKILFIKNWIFRCPKCKRYFTIDITSYYRKCPYCNWENSNSFIPKVQIEAVS